MTFSVTYPLRCTAIAMAAGALTLGFAGTSLAQQVGTAAAVRGDVAVTSSGSTRTPSGGDAMLLGDQVRTQAASGMQVLLLDESVFTVGENNDLVIDRFVYDPDRSVGEIAATSTQGFLRFVSGGVGAIAPDSMTLETPSATIGSRGTSVDVVIGQEAADLARRACLASGASAAACQAQQCSASERASAVFVILRGPSTTYAGITQRGRVRVATPQGSVEVRREGFGVFVPCDGANPFPPIAVPSDVDFNVIASIELPSVGSDDRVPEVDLTDVPQIDFTPAQITGPGNGFRPEDDPSTPPVDLECDLFSRSITTGEGTDGSPFVTQTVPGPLGIIEPNRCAPS